MSTEQRDVRPFAHVGALDDLLHRSTLRVGLETVENDGKVVLDEDVFLRARVTLILASDVATIDAAVGAAASDLASLDVSADDLAFAVVLSSGYLKIAEFACQAPLVELAGLGHEIDLSGSVRPSALRSPRAGCQVEALIYLAKERPRQPLRPWRFGTWISRASFELVTEHGYSGFTPKPLTAAKKVELKLPAKTVRFIVLGDSPLEQGVTEDSVEVWFDADLLAKMSATPKGKTSVALQRQLFIDAVAAVVAAAGRHPDLNKSGWADVKDTLLGRVVAAVAPSSHSEEARARACMSHLELIKSDPAKFLTYAEEAAGLAAAYDSMLEG